METAAVLIALGVAIGAAAGIYVMLQRKGDPSPKANALLGGVVAGAVYLGFKYFDVLG